MFVILVYDVNVKQMAKVLKTARKYLHWVQNSVPDKIRAYFSVRQWIKYPWSTARFIASLYHKKFSVDPQ